MRTEIPDATAQKIQSLINNLVELGYIFSDKALILTRDGEVATISHHQDGRVMCKRQKLITLADVTY